MKMKTNKFMTYALSAMMLGSLAACSSDDSEPQRKTWAYVLSPAGQSSVPLSGGPPNTVLFDLKCMDEARHRELTGVNNNMILENLEKLSRLPDVHDKIIIRLPLIHGLNDGERDMEAICRLLHDLDLKNVDGLPYHSLGVAKRCV